MIGRYKRLRDKMREQGFTQAYMQLKLGYAKSSRYMSDRLTGRVPFEIDKMYRIMDMLYVPHNQMHLYFPPDGIEPEHPALPVDTETKRPERVRLVLEVVEGDIDAIRGIRP